MRSGFLHWFKIFQRWLPYPSTYLSIYLPVSFDPCQVASFETIHLRAEWIYERGTRLERKKGKIENPFPMEKRYPRVQLTPGRIAIENLENVSELSEGKLARLFPLIARRDSHRG